MRLFPNSLNHHPGLWGRMKDSGWGCIYGWVFNGVSEVQGLKMFFDIAWKSKVLSHSIKELNSLAMGLYKYFLLPFWFREVDNLKLPGSPNHIEYPGQAPDLGSHCAPSLCQAGVAQGTDWGGWNQGCSEFILSWNSRVLSEFAPSQKPAAGLRGLPWTEEGGHPRPVVLGGGAGTELCREMPLVALIPRADPSLCSSLAAAQPGVPVPAQAQFTLQCTSTPCQKGHHCFV